MGFATISSPAVIDLGLFVRVLDMIRCPGRARRYTGFISLVIVRVGELEFH